LAGCALPDASITGRGVPLNKLRARPWIGAASTALGNQITPVPITLDGDEHTAQVDLEVVAHHVVEGARVTLQLVATTPAYATPRLGGKLTVTDVALELPTTDDLSPPSND
jgi:hypothetical protein